MNISEGAPTSTRTWRSGVDLLLGLWLWRWFMRRLDHWVCHVGYNHYLIYEYVQQTVCGISSVTLPKGPHSLREIRKQMFIITLAGRSVNKFGAAIVVHNIYPCERNSLLYCDTQKSLYHGRNTNISTFCDWLNFSTVCQIMSHRYQGPTDRRDTRQSLCSWIQLTNKADFLNSMLSLKDHTYTG
jgi:hypothetical protein